MKEIERGTAYCVALCHSDIHVCFVLQECVDEGDTDRERGTAHCVALCHTDIRVCVCVAGVC